MSTSEPAYASARRAAAGPAARPHARRGTIVDFDALGDNEPMDRYAGSARLEWWANRHTCLGAVEVNLEVTVDTAGWHASARFAAPLAGEDLEDWSLLMLADPCFTLRLLEDDQATIDVHVEQAQPDAPMVLTAI